MMLIKLDEEIAQNYNNSQRQEKVKMGLQQEGYHNEGLWDREGGDLDWNSGGENWALW